jgi:hypothetical protein
MLNLHCFKSQVGEPSCSVDSQRNAVGIAIFNESAAEVSKFVGVTKASHWRILSQSLLNLLGHCYAHRRRKDTRGHRDHTDSKLTQVTHHRDHHSVDDSFSSSISDLATLALYLYLQNKVHDGVGVGVGVDDVYNNIFNTISFDAKPK